MIPFKLSAKAKSDLKNIAKFTQEKWGHDQRNIYVKQFDDSFHMLADSPEIGKSCDFIKDGYLKFPQGSHVIFYKLGHNSKIEIIRILHKSMDVTLNLRTP
ncbi:type II toxin-antitoxin system RelE/ParE family toxin [Aestuariirhabdus sp. LZHN29]|uniref:type II toxin-antitoxin system RelE/ParE family toxin n=1 Tax=Aestuariirhabdus sp. LZHN29 TaxID=3417462 RepID=UPI003CE91B80